MFSRAKPAERGLYGGRDAPHTTDSDACSAEQNRGFPRCSEHSGNHPEGRRGYQRFGGQVQPRVV